MGFVTASPRTVVGRAAALTGAAVTCAAVGAGCLRRVLLLASSLRTARADDLVELGVLVTGAAVLVWLAASAAAAAGCLAARSAGQVWRRGEGWVHRFAPGIVRRALVVAVAAGIGAAGATAAAADAAPTPGPIVATAPAVGAGTDLGWVVTAPAPAVAPSAPTTAPAWRTEPTSAADQLGGPPGPGAPTDGPTNVTSPDAPVTAPGRTPPTTGSTPGTSTEAAIEVPTSTPAAAAEPGASTPAGDPGSPRLTGRARDRVPGAPSATPRATPDPEPATVVVLRGDTLWSIAARHLSPDAGPAQVAAAWPAWYAANTVTIGPDPDLILPGQVLVVPAGVTR